MIRTIIISALMLTSNIVQAQTVAKLIEKYRNFPIANYWNTTEETRKAFDENSELTADDRDKLKKNFKMSERVQLDDLNDGQLAQLSKDIKALKGYELLFVINKNARSEETANSIRQMISEVMNPSVKTQCYGKVKGNEVSDLLIRIDMWQTVTLFHIDAKLEKELIIKHLISDDAIISVDDTDDGEVTDLKDVLEEVKKGNVLFVINGQEYPDLRSTEQATEYMKAHDISTNTESWIVGGAVKEKYPNTDRKVVIELSDYTIEMRQYVEKGDVLFVIKGKEHPELRSIEAAEEYMKANNLQCYNQHWVSKDEAKRKYPNTDRKAIIEYY